MMREWLIRTHQNKILGPVSKTKIQELISNNSLIGFDEVCAPDSFWFKVNEKDIVAKYIFGDARPSRNPLSEAKDVKNIDKILEEGINSTNPRYQVPSDADLEYPSVMALDSKEGATDQVVHQKVTSDKTSVRHLCDVEVDKASDFEGVLPSKKDLEYPDS